VRRRDALFACVNSLLYLYLGSILLLSLPFSLLFFELLRVLLAPSTVTYRPVSLSQLCMIARSCLPLSPSSFPFWFPLPLTIVPYSTTLSLSFFLSFFLFFRLHYGWTGERTGFHHHSFLGFNLHTWWRFPFIYHDRGII